MQKYFLPTQIPPFENTRYIKEVRSSPFSLCMYSIEESWPSSRVQGSVFLAISFQNMFIPTDGSEEYIKTREIRGYISPLEKGFLFNIYLCYGFELPSLHTWEVLCFWVVREWMCSEHAGSTQTSTDDVTLTRPMVSECLDFSGIISLS